MDLLQVYKDMNADAEKEKVAEEQGGAIEERMELLSKYAEKATELLKEEYGDDFEENDVTKLASLLIEQDNEYAIAQEKVAEYAQAGQIIATSFKDELDKLTEDNK